MAAPSGEQQFPFSFGAVYALIGAWAIASVLGFFVILYAPVGTIAHKSYVQNALGATEQKQLLVEAEKAIAQEGTNEGLTVTSQKLLKVKHPDADTVIFVIKATTAEFGDVTINVTFHKGIYQIAGLAAA